jgi:superfamily II DNA or RNA helicase
MEARVKAGRKSEVFNHLTIACYESLYGVELIENVTIDPVELSNKYLELFYAITDLDKESEEDSAELDESKIENILELLNESLKIEYGTQLARFARFMFGETQQHTRRLIQLSFNRSNSFPYVLVAQSKVGREGLNLHKACKTVMMLHPEWNPAVAEQQIGRVDRLGSLWAQQIQSYEMGNGEIPRIEIRPMVFKNTYDDQNWRVLRERWDDLRAQLHGIIIPDRIYEICDEEDRKIIEELNDAAPSFMPE